MAHLAEVVERHVPGGDQGAARLPQDRHAVVGHGVLHAGAGDLVHAGAVRLAAHAVVVDGSLVGLLIPEVVHHIVLQKSQSLLILSRQFP